MYSERDVNRFWSRVDRQGDDDCWLFRGAINGPTGSPLIRMNNRREVSARVAWKIQSQEPIPDGLLVCHRCDVPSCVNVKHLFLGTQRDNMQDMVHKGRHRFAYLDQKPKALDRDAVRQLIQTAVSDSK